MSRRAKHLTVRCVLAARGCPPRHPSPLYLGMCPQLGLCPTELVNFKGRQAGSELQEWVLVGPEKGSQLRTLVSVGARELGKEGFCSCSFTEAVLEELCFLTGPRCPCCCWQPPCGLEGRQPGRGQTWAEGRVQRGKMAFFTLH